MGADPAAVTAAAAYTSGLGTVSVRPGTAERTGLDPGTYDDLARWEQELGELDAGPDRPTLFLSLFTAIGRAPG